MLDYNIIGVYFKGAEPIQPQFTDFTDFNACFAVMQESLAYRPGAHMAMNFLCLNDDPIDDFELIVRYGFGGHDGKIIVTVLDQDGTLLTDGFLIQINRDTEKLQLIPMGRTLDEALEDAVKIIEDYGVQIVAGINWGAFLLHESAEGRLEQYFEDAINQEIH